MEPDPAGEVQRLHPASVIFGLGRIVRALIFPAIAALLATGGVFQFWVFLFLVPAAIGAVVQYWFFHYRLAPRELIVRRGVLTRNERHIPYTRIQNINLAQNVLHRWLGVAEARIETAAGEEPEAVMRVLSLDAVERLRAGVFARRDAAGEADAGGAPGSAPIDDSAPEARGEPLVALDARDLFTYGIISNRGMVVVAAIIGAASQLDIMQRYVTGDRVREVIEGWGGNIPTPGALNAVILGVATFLLLVILLRVLSVVLSFVKFHGFRLTMRGDDLRVEYGLLTRITATIPRHRIQVLTTRGGPLHRLFRSAMVQVQTAGGFKGEEGKGVEHRWLAPVLPRERVAGLIGKVLPGVDVSGASWLPLAPRARRRVARRSIRLIVLLTIALAFAVGWWALMLPAAGIPLALVHASLFVRHTAYAVTPDAVLYRSGWFVRRLSVVRFSKVQAVGLSESPFDRRNDMASLRVDTAGAGKLGHRVEIPYLEAGIARDLARQWFREAGHSIFHW